MEIEELKSIKYAIYVAIAFLGFIAAMLVSILKTTNEIYNATDYATGELELIRTELEYR